MVRFVLLLVAIAGLLLSACGGAGSAAPSAGTPTNAARTPTAPKPTPVPFVERTPIIRPRLGNPTPTQVVATRLCGVDDLDVTLRPETSATGGLAIGALAFANRAATACNLSAALDFIFIDAASNVVPARVTFPAELAAVALPPNTPSGGEADGTAYLALSWNIHNIPGGGCSAPWPGAATLLVRFRERGTVSLELADSSLSLPGRGPCGSQLGVGLFGAFILVGSQRPPLPGRFPRPLRIEGPATVKAGGELDYVVVVFNGGVQPYSWSVGPFGAAGDGDFDGPCPPFRQALRGFDDTGVEGPILALNCARLPALGPAEEAAFAMRLQVPASLKPGSYRLVWGFITDYPKSLDTVEQAITVTN